METDMIRLLVRRLREHLIGEIDVLNKPGAAEL